MNDHYIPPFTITTEITNLVAKIAETVGLLTAKVGDLPVPQLRKQNRIKTIHSSLAIENNSLSIEQVTAILEGKRVLGAPNEIKEVKNAIDAYNLLLELNPYKVKDLLRAHKLMMSDLVNEAGRFRSGDVGVMGNQGVVHLGPPAIRVPELMAELLKWVKQTDVHPVISSCVFHYELEFIHPFADGNGRMGRMWQTLLLMQWNPIFAWIPIENIVKDNQQEYYQTIAQSDHQASCTPFIAFMLRCILNALQLTESDQTDDPTKSTLESTLKSTPKIILRMMKENPAITINEIAEHLGLNRRGIAKHIHNLQAQGVIRRVGPNKGGHWETNS